MGTTNMTVATICGRFKHNDMKIMRQVQRDLDAETRVKTIPKLNVAFLMAHSIAPQPFRALLDLMADCVKTAVGKGISAACYPIEVAADGTMTMPPEQTLIKATQSLEFSNFGDNRIGIAVACCSIEPLGFTVAVGPFFELQTSLQAALA